MKTTNPIKPLVLSLIVAGLISPITSFSQQVTDVGIVNATGGQGTAENPKNYPSVVTSPVRTTVEVARPVAELSKEYLDNFTPPVSTFADKASMLPGAYSTSTNGAGGGDEKIWFRGFKDGSFTMTFDGIPFNDTNDPTHHSQVFFPGSFIGGITSDRSPGTASSLGPANYGGTVGILSKPIDNEKRVTGALTFGSFNTQLYEAEYVSGYTEDAPSTKFMINAHHFSTDGAQTFSPQYRDGASFKLESALTSDTVLTAFSSWTHYLSNSGGGVNPSTFAVYNTPVGAANQKYLIGNNMYQSSNNPTRADYYDYSHYDVTASFNYLGIKSNLGDGWNLDNKTYFNYYSNQQNYANFKDASKVANFDPNAATAGIDKLNSYHTIGNILRITKDTSFGTIRTGLQTEYSDTPRHQNYVNPVTGAPTSGGVKFNEDFQTTIIQPYLEVAFKATEKLTITPGIKYNYFSHNLKQYPDDKTNGTVGTLNGQAFVQNSRTYGDVLPFIDARYMLQNNWSVYAQYSTGDVIPPTSTYDVTGSSVSVLPDPIRTKTYQIGSVYQAPSYMVDADIFQTNATTSYSSAVDGSGFTYYYSSPSTTYKGIEASGNVVLGGGFNVYGSAMGYQATYDTTGLAVANVPSDMEALGVFYRNNAWSIGGMVKRIGPQYQDNTKATQVNQWYSLDPIFITNLYANYTFNNVPSYMKSAKIRFGVDNLFNKNYLVAFVPGASNSTTPGVSTLDTVQYSSGIAAYASLILNF
jgi:iron complex outermembrane receptor protein